MRMDIGMSSPNIDRAFYLTFLFIFIIGKVQSYENVFNVLHYGAFPGVSHDNSQALSNAWNEACQSEGQNVVLVPLGDYLVRPVVLKGPCKGLTEFRLLGILRAATDESSSLDYNHWISFQYVDNFVLGGGGALDGQGPSAWHYNNCSKNISDCKPLPVSLNLDFITNAWINHIKLINSKNFHMSIFQCNHMVLENLGILAPGDSPNTDGIHIAESTDINIRNSIIGVGDDCISMGPGCSGINISFVQCGPGHGFSIGSLGKTPNEHNVDGVVISNSRIIGTQNGLRIKTWSPSTPSSVSNVTFEHIRLVDVENPIIIDQLYCPNSYCGEKSYSGVGIEDVKYINIWGTSKSKVAVDFKCSEKVPCQKIELDDINIVYQGLGGGADTSTCSNAHGVAYGQQNPPSCL